MYKTVRKVRNQIPSDSYKKRGYSGIGNNTYHTYDYVQVRIHDGPSPEEIKKRQEEEEQAKLEEEKEAQEEERLRAKKARRFDPKVNQMKKIQRQIDAVINNEKGKLPKNKTF